MSELHILTISVATGATFTALALSRLWYLKRQAARLQLRRAEARRRAITFGANDHRP